jgi:hypothetical protein
MSEFVASSFLLCLKAGALLAGVPVEDIGMAECYHNRRKIAVAAFSERATASLF